MADESPNTDEDRELLDDVWRRLNDQVLLEREDLRESLEQVRQGRGRMLRPFAQERVEGDS